MSQGMCVASWSWKSEEKEFSPKASRKEQSNQYLDFNPVRPMLEF